MKTFPDAPTGLISGKGRFLLSVLAVNSVSHQPDVALLLDDLADPVLDFFVWHSGDSFGVWNIVQQLQVSANLVKELPW
jgi:hypothetical protein